MVVVDVVVQTRNFPALTAKSPSLSFIEDSNSGIYSAVDSNSGKFSAVARHNSKDITKKMNTFII